MKTNGIRGFPTYLLTTTNGILAWGGGGGGARTRKQRIVLLPGRVFTTSQANVNTSAGERFESLSGFLLFGKIKPFVWAYNLQYL